MATDFLRNLLMEKSIIICGGSGGVGKTTTSAALGLQAALLGRKALVLTIDPARRLANSLGLEILGNNIARVDKELFRKAGLEVPGELYAMMLDCKRTFDDVVTRYAPTPAAAKAILGNRFYQHMASAMTGSHEYMAMEKVYDLFERHEFDLLVLDTPPTHNALDFLEAPNRMTHVLDDSILRWFLKPYFVAGKFSFKTAQAGSKIVFHVLERITGVQVLQDISEFFLSFSGMYEGFKQRAEKVRNLLRDSCTSFVLVTSPHRITVEECIFYSRRLRDYGVPLGGVVVNKVHPDFGVPEHTNAADLVSQSQLAGAVPEAGLKNLAANLLNFQMLADLDRDSIAYLRAQTNLTGDQLRLVRYFDDDLYALGDLKRMIDELFPAAAPQAKPGASQEVTVRA